MSSTTRRHDWQRTILVRAHARATRVREKQRYVDVGRIQITVGAGFLSALSQAAERRGLSVTAYMRRAIAAFVAADTGLALPRLLAEVPHPQGPAHGKFDDGTGYGEWVASPFADDTGVI
jgi:hypothetical protein